MGEPLVKRRELIEKHILPTLADPIRYSPILEGSLKNLIESVKAHGLEGLVAKRANSKYEPGQRSGAWLKMRVKAGQELVIHRRHFKPLRNCRLPANRSREAYGQTRDGSNHGAPSPRPYRGSLASPLSTSSRHMAMKYASSYASFASR
jgi:hypothetical protein